jgi:glutathione S-transferase
VAEIILHHYPRSPYAEKVRLALGLKELTYHSVTIPTWMPKPDLIPLTGGYRRTPVMQVKRMEQRITGSLAIVRPNC